MGWINFEWYVWGTIATWLAGMTGYFHFQHKPFGRQWLTIASAAGVLVIFGFIVALWTQLERPPMRTLGETRLWYSFWLAATGLVLYLRWKHLWLLVYSLGMSILFLLINLLKPETHDQTLMPALQSPWFIPHVLVYLFAYALLAASSFWAVKGLFMNLMRKQESLNLNQADQLVYGGFAFLSLGLIFGALWAKEAWGHYWTWDPKETWALLTWLFYLLYIHLRYHIPKKLKLHSWILGLSFVVLLICWFGVNYLATAENSVHTYSG